MPDQDSAAPPRGNVEFLTIPLDAIVPSPKNRKYSDGDQRVLDMAVSIRDNGLINPISVRPLGDGRYEIIGGESRYRAMRELGFTETYCRVRDCDEGTAQVERIIENRQRSELSPLEDGDCVKTLLQYYNDDYDEVAARLNITSVTWLRRLARIPDLIPAWREELERQDSPYAHIAESRAKMIEIAILPPETQQRVLDDGLFEFVKSPKEMRQRLEKEFMRLSAKPWSRQWEKDNYSGSSKKRPRCDNCDRRSDRQPHLFSDLEAEVPGDKKAMCLNPDCWHAKEIGWCKEQLKNHPGAIPVWDGYSFTPRAEEMVRESYGVSLARAWSWEERKEKNGAGFTIAAKGVFVGGPRIGQVIDIVLRDESEDERDDAERHERVRQRKEQDNRLREEYDALRAKVEDVVPGRVDWLIMDGASPFFRWCVWFGLPASRHSDDKYTDSWTPCRIAWEDDLREELINTVMQYLLPDSQFNHSKMQSADVGVIVGELEAMLGANFASLLPDADGKNADGDA